MNSIAAVDKEKAWELIQKGAKLLDVRTEKEFVEGHLEGAINIPHDRLAGKVPELGLQSQETILLYCKSGGRSDFAMKVLKQLGFTNAINIGGYEELINFSK